MRLHERLPRLRVEGSQMLLLVLDLGQAHGELGRVEFTNQSFADLRRAILPEAYRITSMLGRAMCAAMLATGRWIC